MTLTNAQKIGVGALLGGVATVGASMLLRYFAANKGTSAGAGKPVSYPVWWEHAPLIGILAGAAATALAYYLWGTEAAVAAGITAVIAGVSPESDAWVTEARAEKDLEALTVPCPEGKTRQADGSCAGLHGSNVVEMRARVAALESELESFRRAA